MVFPKHKKIWTDWEWIEPKSAYSLYELDYYMFGRYVGSMQDDGSFKAEYEIRIVPVDNY